MSLILSDRWWHQGSFKSMTLIGQRMCDEMTLGNSLKSNLLVSRCQEAHKCKTGCGYFFCPQATEPLPDVHR